MKIGVFDSGLGGEIVANRLANLFPGLEFMTANDRSHLPYGDKTADEIVGLTDQAIQGLLSSCQVIIIACNTATAAAIGTLRTRYPKVEFIGFEPAIKPAANGARVGSIMVLATPATLESNKYLRLKKRYARNITAIEPDCSTWASRIESGMFQRGDLLPVVKLAREHRVQAVVLGCTHYLAIESEIAKLLPEATIQTQIVGVANRLNRVMLKYSYASSETSRNSAS